MKNVVTNLWTCSLISLLFVCCFFAQNSFSNPGLTNSASDSFLGLISQPGYTFIDTIRGKISAKKLLYRYKGGVLLGNVSTIKTKGGNIELNPKDNLGATDFGRVLSITKFRKDFISVDLPEDRVKPVENLFNKVADILDPTVKLRKDMAGGIHRTFQVKQIYNPQGSHYIVGTINFDGFGFLAIGKVTNDSKLKFVFVDCNVADMKTGSAGRQYDIHDIAEFEGHPTLIADYGAGDFSSWRLYRLDANEALPASCPASAALELSTSF